MEKFCTKCGEKNDSNAKFCEQCGAAITSEVRPGIPRADFAGKGLGRAKRAIFLALGGIVFAAVVATAIYFLSPSKPSERVIVALLNQRLELKPELVDKGICDASVSYQENPLRVQRHDLKTRIWMNGLVKVGVYSSPVREGGLYGAFAYSLADEGAKSVRNNKLCIADSYRVTKLQSSVGPQLVDGKRAMRITYQRDYLNLYSWANREDLDELLPRKPKLKGTILHAALVEGESGWNIVNLVKTDEIELWKKIQRELLDAPEQKRAGHSSTGGGWLSGISNWFSGLSARSPDEVVKKFYLDAERGNVDAVIASLSSKSGAMMGKEKMRAMVEEQQKYIESQGGILAIETETKVEGDTARGHVTTKYKNGRKKVERINLIKEDGKWKLGV